MSKDIAYCRKEIVSTFLSCLAYLKAQKLIKPLYRSFSGTEAEDGLIQEIEDTLRLFAPDLLKEAEHD